MGLENPIEFSLKFRGSYQLITLTHQSKQKRFLTKRMSINVLPRCGKDGFGLKMGIYVHIGALHRNQRREVKVKAGEGKEG